MHPKKWQSWELKSLCWYLALGLFLGAKLGGILPDKAVLRAYQVVVVLVMLLNIANGMGLQ